MLVAQESRCCLPLRARSTNIAFQTRGLATRSSAFPRLPVRKSFAVNALLDSASAAASSLIQTTSHHLNVLATLADDAAINTAAAAATTTSQGGGPFDFLADFFESTLKIMDDGLENAGVPYSYGFAIILLTLAVKLGTFPLTQKQVQSTVAIQALQPRVKELQAKHANDAETLQLETAKLYREAGVNPLAGCLPTLATIPVFIGLYRALTKAAEDNLLDQDFFWIPSLAGPATLADRQSGAGLTWLFPFVDGHPPIGWGSAAAYLVLPVLLVVSQYVSQKIISPTNTNDPAAQQSQAILKFLPLMIGWFSLNVPSGLTLYWFINNILSTAQQIYLKKTTKVNIPEPAGPNPNVISSSTPYIAPKEEKVKKLSGKDLGSRKKRRDDDAIDVEATVSSSNGSASAPAAAPSKSGGDKFRAQKAKEAAAKAAAAAQVPAPSSTEADSPKSE